MMANRLKMVLDKVISLNQSAFVLGRLITDNVFAEFESLHSLRNTMSEKKGCLALKLDMNDSIMFVKASLSEYCCLRDILRRYEEASRELINFEKNKRQVFEKIKDMVWNKLQDERLRKWNEEVMNDSFLVSEAELILSISLSINARKDSFLCHFDIGRSLEGNVLVWVCRPVSKVWTLPNSGNFKLNVDATLDFDNCRYGAGVVIRDDRGTVVVAATLSFVGTVSIDIDEAKTILEGLLLANNFGLFQVSVESDALEVVGLCNRKSNSFGDIDNIICDLLSLKAKCINISIVNVPRECNRVAHSIARFAILNGCSNVWSVVFSDWLYV
ncbi:hypothetical protein Ddye_012087 [Dipteronia dyeriana]|uniref:RNase H type-1 domain-containing protein n=1 Tax=Dipteronia dyeriana TaxID=168575 RepID=A0AAD9X3P8_9ROSI|nr:hypothetical protein Ddye_012087 [Dipteronia dyeriana]